MGRALRGTGLLTALLVVVAALAGPLLAGNAAEPVGLPYPTPGEQGLLGTDRLGRDVAALTAQGGALLVLVAATVAVGVTALATLIGVVAGLSRRAGVVLDAVTDALILVPSVLGVLLVVLL